MPQMGTDQAVYDYSEGEWDLYLFFCYFFFIVIDLLLK